MFPSPFERILFYLKGYEYMNFIKLLSGDTEIVKHIHTDGDYVLSDDNVKSGGFHHQPENVRFRYIFDFGKKGSFLEGTAPKGGEFYLALQVQDSFGTYDEEFRPIEDHSAGPFSENMVELTVNGKPAGRFRYGGDDGKYYLFVTEEAVELNAGDKIRYTVVSGGRVLFTSILLLHERPEEQMNEILNITSDNGELRFWTKLASRVSVITGEEIFSEGMFLNNHRYTIPKKYWGLHLKIEAIDEQGNILRARATCRERKMENNKNAEIKIPLTAQKRDGSLLPTTGVVPLAEGQLFSVENINISDDSGSVYVTDKKVTSKWQDGSIRTIVVGALLPSDGRTFYAQNASAAEKEELGFSAKLDDSGVSVFANGKKFIFKNDENSVLPDKRMLAVLYDENCERYVACGGKWEIKENGFNHIELCRENHFEKDGRKHFKSISILHFYRGVAAYSLEFAFENDLIEHEFTTVSGLYLEAEDSGESFELVQLDEKTARKDGKVEEMRAQGEFCAFGEKAKIEDFWQNYPKSIEVEEGLLKIGICPFITEPEHYVCEEDFSVEARLFFYLKTGKYEFHCGLKKYHTIFFGRESEKLEKTPFLVPSKESVETSGAFGHITCHCEDFPNYDEYMSNSMELYLNHREKYREYGMLNYGDSFGEREIHWTNMEYDFPFGVIIHFLRTGDERFLEAARAAAPHLEGIDCSHRNYRFEEDGWPFIHTVGHANNYYPIEKVPTSFYYIKSHIGHIFMQGMTEYYKVTGIERYKDFVVNCANSIARYYTRKYDFLTEREPGWSMMTLEAAYELTLDPYYLNACRLILERVYQKQDPDTGCLKYFMYMVGKEGETGEVCYGGKSFMHGIVGSAAKYFYYLTGDERAKQAAIDIARWLAEDMFDEEMNQFWYTEAFKRISKRVSQPETNIEILDVVLFACLEIGNKKYLEIARRAFDTMLESPYRRECDISKVFSMRMRFSPEIMHDYAKAREMLGEF